MTVQLRRLALGLLVIVAAVGVEFTAASAAVPANASCLGYGSSVTAPLHLRAGIATNPESSRPELTPAITHTNMATRSTPASPSSDTRLDPLVIAHQREVLKFASPTDHRLAPLDLVTPREVPGREVGAHVERRQMTAAEARSRRLEGV